MDFTNGYMLGMASQARTGTSVDYRFGMIPFAFADVNMVENGWKWQGFYKS